MQWQGLRYCTLRIVTRTRNLKRSLSMSIFISYRPKLSRNKHLESLLFLKSPRKPQGTSWFSWKLVWINPCCRNLHSLCKICLHFLLVCQSKTSPNLSTLYLITKKKKKWKTKTLQMQKEKLSGKIREFNLPVTRKRPKQRGTAVWSFV
jgi:hypothetical protein